MILNLSGEINNEMFNELCQAVNMCVDKQEALRIYLWSEGGMVNSMYGMIHLINEFQDVIELVGYGNLSSAAFVLFFEAKCKKSVLQNTDGMAHLAYSTFLIDSRGKIKNETDEVERLHGIKLIKNDFIKLFKRIGFTKEEIDAINQGKNVYFTYKQMNELINGKRKLNSKGTGTPRGKDRGISIIFEAESDSVDKEG